MNRRAPAIAALVLLAACGGNGSAGTSFLEGVGRIPGSKSVGVEVQSDGAVLSAPGVQGAVLGAGAMGNRLLVIGDSILAGTANRYGGEMCASLVPLGWRVAVEAEAGRPASFGREVLRARLDEGWDAAVVFLGTNPSPNIDRYEQDMTRIVESLAPRPTLLLTTSLFRDSQKATNEVIRKVATAHGNVSILDWGTASAQPGVLNTDGVHPTTVGRALLVKAVTAAVGNAPSSPGRCLGAEFTDDSSVTGVMPSTTVAGIPVITTTTGPATPAVTTPTVPATATTASPAPVTTVPPASTTTAPANPTTTTRP